MSAPAATVRQTPSGLRLEDGFSSLVTFAADPDVSLWETEVTPPGVDGGDAVPTTTMHNTVYRTKSPRLLKELTQMSFTAAYDPAVLTQIVALTNVRTTVTVRFPDGSTWAAFGYLQKFEPGNLTEGEMPTATCTVEFTNRDASGAEQGPVLVSVPGT